MVRRGKQAHTIPKAMNVFARRKNNYKLTAVNIGQELNHSVTISSVNINPDTNQLVGLV
jgi:hypothetical protein